MIKFREKGQSIEDKPFDVAKSKLEELITNCSKYKIGKTGQTLEERLSQYKSNGEDFKRIEELYKSESSDIVSKLESDLIDNYINDDKCENIKDGGHSISDHMDIENKVYYAYVVLK